MKKVKFKNYDCVIKRTKYIENENLALVLMDAKTDELIAHVTVNSIRTLPDDVALVKNYSENIGMLEAITDAGLIEAEMGTAQLGFVRAPIVKFNLKDVEQL